VVALFSTTGRNGANDEQARNVVMSKFSITIVPEIMLRLDLRPVRQLLRDWEK
jgi:hypothetical protein